MKIIVVVVIALAFASCQTDNKQMEQTIQGEWGQTYTRDGKPFEMVARFKPNGVVDVMGNGKLIISQEYRVTSDSIIFSKDPSCDPGSLGVYKLTYLKDSVRFNIVNDSCELRIQSTDKVALARIKKG